MLAQRMERIEGSGVRKMFELGAAMEDSINLSIGQADYAVPEEVQEAAIRAIYDGRNRYTVTEGVPELNEATLGRLAADFGHRPEAILMTAGVSGGLLLTFLALIDPGDEVLLPDPYFVMYKNAIELVGAKAVYFDLYPSASSGGWQPDLDEVAARMTDRTKAILLNSPTNPTGGVLSSEELDAFCAIAERAGAWIVADEIYAHFVYDRPFASMIPRMERWRRTIVLNGFSKTYAIPGWRLGYAVGPRRAVDAMKLVQQYTYVCPPAPLQYGALAALDLDMSDERTAYERKRNLVSDSLADLYDLIPSAGSFFAFPGYPQGMDERQFIAACTERKLLIVPGSAFSRRATNFRLSFAVSDDILARGLAVLREVANAS